VNHPTSRSTRPPLLLAAALVAVAWGALYDAGRWVALFIVNPVHLDFRIFYVAAEAGLRYGWSRIYDLETLQSLSSSFPADERYINSAATFIHPPFLAWLVAPLTILPLPAAYVVWTLLSLAALVWAWHISAPYRGLVKLALLLLALALWPVMDSFYYGQPSILVLALVATAWWLSRKDRSVLAGVALAFATILKPQVVILVPVALLVSGRFRPFAAWAVAGAALAALCAINLGPSGVAAWWQTLIYVQGDHGHSFFTMAYLFGSGPVSYGLEALQGVLALVIARRRRKELDMVFALGLLGSLTFAFHLHQPDYSSLVLAAWLVLRTATPLWHRLWLLVGIVTMQAVTLGYPAPQLLWDLGWLLILAVSSFYGSGASDPATRAAASSGAHAGT
jgi:hypothetical protein